MNYEYLIEDYRSKGYAATSGGPPNTVDDLLSALDAIGHMAASFGEDVAGIAIDARECIAAGLRDGYYRLDGPVG